MFFRIKLRLLLDQIQVIRRYYKKPLFALADLALFFLYLFSNPYRISRKFLQKKGALEIHAYGETPLSTLEHLVRTFHITPQDRWLELGSGRGKTSLWLALYWGCSVRAIDWVPHFVAKGSLLARLFCPDRLTFHLASIAQADFSWPSVVFLYSTCMTPQEISSLLNSMHTLAPQTKIITISEPLNHPFYPLTDSTSVSFPWGTTKAYLHIKKTRILKDEVL